jgi:hypothetical protein
MPLFDPTTVPSEVASLGQVEDINRIVDELRARRAQRIVLREPLVGFRASNKIRAYCQGHLWRCVELIESAETLRRLGHGIAAVVMVRAIYESVASFLHFETSLDQVMEPLETGADLKRVYDFVHQKTFATRRKQFLKLAPDEVTKATNILTQMGKLGAVFPDGLDTYEYLSEFAHPNALGAALWFGLDDPETDVMQFSSVGPRSEEALIWTLHGALLLRHFGAAFDRIEDKLPGLSASAVRIAGGPEPR